MEEILLPFGYLDGQTYVVVMGGRALGRVGLGFWPGAYMYVLLAGLLSSNL